MKGLRNDVLYEMFKKALTIKPILTVIKVRLEVEKNPVVIYMSNN